MISARICWKFFCRMAFKSVRGGRHLSVPIELPPHRDWPVFVPGALIGLGCGLCAGGMSTLNAVLCAVLAAFVGIVLEWRHFPFVADESFGFFVSHLHELRGITWLMVALGSIFAYWFGRGWSRGQK